MNLPSPITGESLAEYHRRIELPGARTAAPTDAATDLHWNNGWVRPELSVFERAVSESEREELDRLRKLLAELPTLPNAEKKIACGRCGCSGPWLPRGSLLRCTACGQLHARFSSRTPVGTSTAPISPEPIPTPSVPEPQATFPLYNPERPDEWTRLVSALASKFSRGQQEALLDLFVPKLSTAARDALDQPDGTPARPLVIWNTTTEQIESFDGTAWRAGIAHSYDERAAMPGRCWVCNGVRGGAQHPLPAPEAAR